MANQYPLVINGQPVDADAWFNPVAEDLTAVASGLVAWTTYTPTWDCVGASPVLGNGTLVGKYSSFGQTTEFLIMLAMGSTTTFGGGAWFFTLPTGANSWANARTAGTAWAFDLSAGQVYSGGAWIGDGPSTGSAIYRIPMGLAANVGAGPTVPFAWAVGDYLTISGRYQTL